MPSISLCASVLTPDRYPVYSCVQSVPSPQLSIRIFVQFASVLSPHTLSALHLVIYHVCV